MQSQFLHVEYSTASGRIGIQKGWVDDDLSSSLIVVEVTLTYYKINKGVNLHERIIVFEYRSIDSFLSYPRSLDCAVSLVT